LWSVHWVFDVFLNGVLLDDLIGLWNSNLDFIRHFFLNSIWIVLVYGVWYWHFLFNCDCLDVFVVFMVSTVSRATTKIMSAIVSPKGIITI
jgi:hypothetical protein